MYIYLFVCCICVYENQYLPSSFTYSKKLLNNGFELVLRAFLLVAVVVVVSINFTLLSRALVVVVIVVAYIVVVTLSHTPTHRHGHALCEIQGVSFLSFH